MNKKYIPVLVCSSKKTKDWFSYKGKAFKFAASPETAPKDKFTYYRPDDPIPGENRTWRDLVLNGQSDPALDLVPAYCLYSRDIYRDLYRKFGNRFYILSAGWGIIRADFKIPAYDIAYSEFSNVLNHLKEDSAKFDSNSEIILFAGRYYLPPFRCMTKTIPFKKTITLYRKKEAGEKEGFRENTYQESFHYVDYKTDNPRTWVYEAAYKFLNIIQK
jgi:hypothetical protein